MTENWMEKPAVPLLLFFAGGILTLHPSDFFNVLIPLYYLFLAGILIRFRHRKTSAVVWILAFVLGRVFGLSPDLSPVRHSLLSEHIPAHTISVRGQVERPIQYSDGLVRFQLAVDQFKNPANDNTRWGETRGKVRFTLPALTFPLDPGDRIQIDRVKLYRPRRFKNLGSFDYERWMKNQGVDASSGIQKLSQIRILRRPPEKTWTAGMERLKYRLSILLSIYSRPGTSGITEAMILGNTGYLRNSDREVFQKSGIAHLLSISGLHMGFIAFFFYFLAYPLLFHLLFRLRPRWCRAGYPWAVTAGLTIPLICLYAFFIGYKTPAVRSAIMITVFLVSILLERTRDLGNTLAIAALLILVWDPSSLFDPGFQLSFMAVLGIVVTLSRQKDDPGDGFSPDGSASGIFRWLNFRSIKNFIWISWGANIAILPLVLVYFNQISISGFVCNLILIPIASLATPLSLLSLGIAPVGFPELISLTSNGMWLIQKIGEFFSELPGGSFFLSSPPNLSILGYYLAVLTALSRTTLNRKAILIGMGAALILIPWGVKPLLFFRPGLLQVHFLDVGQGDGALVRLPNGKNILIDGGGSRGQLNIGRDVIGPYLRDIQVSRIDTVVATHGDLDHIGGLEPILESWKVGRFIDNGSFSTERKSVDLRNISLRKGARYLPASSTADIELDPFLSIKVFHPSHRFLKELAQRPAKGKISSNNTSVVLSIRFGQVSVLFTGDIEEPAESYLVDSGTPLRSLVLKVPHHGSRTSGLPKFLDAVSPRYAVISCGFRNSSGHPHRQILRKYRKRGIHLYRTDIMGEIVLETDGTHVKFLTFRELQENYSRFSFKNLFL